MAAAALAAAPARAGLLVSETFSYAAPAPGGTTLDGKAGGTGFGGAWASQLGTVTGGEYTVGGNSPNAAVRSLAAPITGDIYFGFDFRFLGHVDVNDFASLWFDDGTSTGIHTTVPNVGLKGQRGDGSGPEDAFIRLTGTSGTFHPTALTEGHVYRIVGKLSKVTGKGNRHGDYYNTMRLWIDPDAEAGVEGVDFVTATAARPSLAAVTRVGIRTGDLDFDKKTLARDSVGFDNLMIGESFGDVAGGTVGAAAVPGPPVAAMAAGGAFGLGLFRRARRRA